MVNCPITIVACQHLYLCLPHAYVTIPFKAYLSPHNSLRCSWVVLCHVGDADCLTVIFALFGCSIGWRTCWENGSCWVEESVPSLGEAGTGIAVGAGTVAVIGDRVHRVVVVDRAPGVLYNCVGPALGMVTWNKQFQSVHIHLIRYQRRRSL